MKIESPNISAADHLADCWVALASEQRDHDSRLAAAANRPEMYERIGRAIASDNVRVAREDDAGIVGFVMFDMELGSIYRSDRNNR